MTIRNLLAAWLELPRYTLDLTTAALERLTRKQVTR